MGKYHRYVGGKVGYGEHPYAPREKKHCAKCGLELGFKLLPSGKYCPTNADGTDHFDICRLTQFLNAKRDVCVGMTTTMTVPTRKLDYYAGDIPPWDARRVHGTESEGLQDHCRSESLSKVRESV